MYLFSCTRMFIDDNNNTAEHYPPPEKKPHKNMQFLPNTTKPPRIEELCYQNEIVAKKNENVITSPSLD